MYAYVENDPVNLTDPDGLLERGFSLGFGSCVNQCVDSISGDQPQDEIVVTGYRPPPSCYLCSDSAVYPEFGRDRFGAGHFRIAFEFVDGRGGQAQAPANDKLRCIAPTDGPVFFEGGGLDLVLGTGAGISVFAFQIPSTGAKGTAATGTFAFGFGGALGGTAGGVNEFGNFVGRGFKFDAGIPGTPIGGELLLNNQGRVSGGAFSVAGGGGAFFGITSTNVLRSNPPICGQ